MLRKEIVFCSQFVISDPDPMVLLDFMRECCAYSRNVDDCRMYQWDVLKIARPVKRPSGGALLGR